MVHYLNIDALCTRDACEGLEVEDGVLRLARVPGDPEALLSLAGGTAPLAGPAGIGVDRDGTLYVADPAAHRIIRVDGCDGQQRPLPCLRGPGSAPGQLDTPRGVLVGPRGALYVADSGNHRVQVLDLPTLQVRAVWGPPDPYGPPAPGEAPGQLDEPWDLAADGEGYVYVVEAGNRRVQKFDASGHVLPSFWEAMAPDAPVQPVNIATTRWEGEERLLVLDQGDDPSGTARVLLYRLDGTFDAEATEQWEAVAVQHVGGLAAAGGFLYVGDAAQRRVLVFRSDGSFVGVARGYQGPVAGLALDRQGRLLVHPGAGGSVQRLASASAYVPCGTFLFGPVEVGAPARWHRLRVQAEALPDGAHLQLFACASDTHDGSDAAHRPDLPAVCSAGGTPISSLEPPQADDRPCTWHALPVDGTEGLLTSEPGQYLWVAGLLRGTGSASPALRQLRVDYDHETWLHHLPALYRRDATSQQFLDRALSLFESLFEEQDILIDDLPLLFDPMAAPDADAPSSWLDWLSGWMAFSLDESWSEPQRREALAGAFSLLGRRGTVGGLREMLRLYTGVTAHIEEPARRAGLWALGEHSTLGFSTHLAPAEPGGAVVGTTATLGGAHLLQEEDYGAPLFDDVAHRFCVRVYAADVPGGDGLEAVQAVLDREKPAHTTYHLCQIGPHLRVGFQARLGIDAIVGGPPDALVPGQSGRLGQTATLASEPEESASAIGRSASIGTGTLLT